MPKVLSKFFLPCFTLYAWVEQYWKLKKNTSKEFDVVSTTIKEINTTMSNEYITKIS
jgi:hypothetical protein